jgi:hypothetical protein
MSGHGPLGNWLSGSVPGCLNGHDQEANTVRRAHQCWPFGTELVGHFQAVCREHNRHDVTDVMDAGREIGVWSLFDPRQRNTYSCDHWMTSMGVK